MSGLPYFTFKGHSSLDFGLYIVTKGSHHGAARDVAYTSVPGRSGDLVIDNGRYKNIQIPYKLALLNTSGKSFSVVAKEIRDWLLSESGYFRLSDTYDSEYFRLAAYSDEADIEQELSDVGNLSIAFNCKPFKYSFSGQNTVTLTRSGSTITNPESFESLPYIKITGTGTIKLTVNGKPFTFTGVSEYVEVDSEMMNCFKGNILKNDTMTSDGFPVLKPGNNTISWTGVVTKVEIIPRWCCL